MIKDDAGVDWAKIENGHFEQGTKEYILQKHLQNRKEIIKKHEAFTKQNEGILDYWPLDNELRDETKRFKEEWDKVSN